MADQWEQCDAGRYYLSITRGEFVASVGVVYGIGGQQYYWEITRNNGRTAACGTAGSVDCAKRAAETALKELMQ